MSSRATESIAPLLIGGFLLALISLAAFLLLLGYADLSYSPCCRSRTESDMAGLTAAVESYRHDLGWPPTSFANPHIVALLDGHNPRGRVFFEFPARELSPQGEFLDEWDTPFRFDPPADNIEAIRITSAGQDRTFGTKDDIKSY